MPARRDFRSAVVVLASESHRVGIVQKLKSAGMDIAAAIEQQRYLPLDIPDGFQTSHQIRTQADRLLGQRVSDVDGNVEERRSTISLFNGPSPTIKVLDTTDEETAAVGGWLKALANDTSVTSPPRPLREPGFY